MRSVKEIEQTTIMLILRFGSMQLAFEYWFNMPFNKLHGLTETELAIIYSHWDELDDG